MKPALLHLLPAYPRTINLPWKPNIDDGDIIATSEEARVIFTAPHVVVEEKIDGASVGAALIEDNALIRNRDHILRKGYHKKTAAKMQFASIWNWFYDHIELFKKINSHGPYSVYAEWCLAAHGIYYDQLKSLFNAFAIYDQCAGEFIDPEVGRKMLSEAGFVVPPLIHVGRIESYEQLEAWTREPSAFASNSLREGIYLKIGDGQWTTHRFKMVRADYVRGALWDSMEITKNKKEVTDAA